MAKGPEIWVCPQCGFRLDIAQLGLYAEVQCPRCFRTERVHAQLSNFRLDAVIGVGGMSVVYRAFDVVLHRPLALKVLNDTFRDQPERIERFENESAMMARVRHENVTSVYSAGRAYGQFYIAMELIEGKNLEYMVSAEQPMGAQQALDIIRQVASGLQAAHRAGLLHRDMKPGNILITEEGLAKVIDFGLAMDSREGDTEEIIWATPYYVPPETLRRDPEDVRTDIYALGMTLRFLLTGIESFATEVSSLSALIQCKRNLTPLARQRRDIPAELAELVDHMTQFSPSARPADYTELLAEIAEVQQELALRDTPAYKRRIKLIRTVSLAGALGIGALMGLLFAPSPPQKKRALIPLPAAAAKQDTPANDVMPSVLEQLESKDYAQAVNLLLSAAEKESDPCLGAWYAQLARTILGSRRNDPAAAELAYELLSRHLANSSRVLPSGERSFRTLKEMDPRRYPNSQDWTSGTSEWNSITRAEIVKDIDALEKSDIHPVFKVLKWYVIAEKASWLGFTELADRCIERIKGSTTLGEYEVLSEILSEPSIHRRSSGFQGEYLRAESSMREKDFATAMERFSSFASSSSLSDRSRSQAQVLYEVCETAKSMLELLQRKAPARYRANMSDEELISLARGLSPASRPAVWVNSFQNGHPAEHAIDGNLETRWTASNGDNGNSFSLDIDTPEPLSSIVLCWENDQKLSMRIRIYSGGKVYTQEIEKDKHATRLALKDMVVDRVEILFTGGAWLANWAGVSEVQLITKDDKTITPDARTGRNDFADELRAVLLMVAGRYNEAFAQMDFVAAREGSQSLFSLVAADWRRRWNSASPSSESNLAQVANSEKVEHRDIIRLCKECVMVKVLPGKKIKFRNRSVPLVGGNMMFCSGDIAQKLEKRGDVTILPIDIVPILGLKGMRYNSFTIIPGEIQPCRKDDAQHFQELGAGKIINSVDDLWDVRDKIKPDPFPIMLRRVVEL